MRCGVAMIHSTDARIHSGFESVRSGKEHYRSRCEMDHRRCEWILIWRESVHSLHARIRSSCESIHSRHEWIRGCCERIQSLCERIQSLCEWIRRRCERIQRRCESLQSQSDGNQGLAHGCPRPEQPDIAGKSGMRCPRHAVVTMPRPKLQNPFLADASPSAMRDQHAPGIMPTTCQDHDSTVIGRRLTSPGQEGFLTAAPGRIDDADAPSPFHGIAGTHIPN